MSANDYLTLGISSLALVLSIISTVIATRQQSLQLQTTLRDQLSSIVQALVSSLAKNQTLQGLPASERGPLYYAKASSLTQKLAQLARQAAALIAQDNTIGSDVEFCVVAQAFDRVGDAPEADRFWLLAVKASPSDYYRLINKRGYADYLFRQGRTQPGRKMYEEALEIVDSASDFNKWTNGYTYQMWFNSEAWNVPPPAGRAEQCYLEARGLFEAISVPGARNGCLQGLEAIRSNAAQGSSGPPRETFAQPLQRPEGPPPSGVADPGSKI